MNAPAAGAALGAIRVRWQRLAEDPRLAAVATAVRQLAPPGTLRLVPYALYTIALFVIFLAKTFPHELVLRHVLEPAATAPVAIEVRGVELGWTLAYTIDELRLVRRGGDPSLPLLTASHVHAAPSVLGLLRGRPFPLALRADLYGGTVAGTVDLRPDGFAVDATAANLDLARYPGFALVMEGTPQGRFDATLALAGDTMRPTTVSGRIELRASELALEHGKVQGITVPDLHFPDLHLAGNVKAGRLELAEMNAHGREVSIAGTGNLLLAHIPSQSLVNVDLALVPAADLADNLRLALTMIAGEPDTRGERHVRLRGSLDDLKATK